MLREDEMMNEREKELRRYLSGRRFDDEALLDTLILMSQKMGILFPGYMER